MTRLRSLMFVLVFIVQEKGPIISVTGSKVSKIFENIDPCHFDDKVCLLKSARKLLPYFVVGDPTVGIPSADPLELENVNADTEALRLQFKDMKVVGNSRCLLTNLERPTLLTGKLSLECPITATGLYELKGQIAGIDIFGKGPFKFETEKIKLDFDIDMKKVKGTDGEEHYKIAKFNYEYDPVEKIHLHFDNLYDGDETKAKPIRDIMDSGWREMTSTVGKPVIEEIVKKAINCVDKFFAAAPANQIELQ